MTCDHTFGTEDNYDGGYNLVLGEKNLIETVSEHSWFVGFEAFTYCPDCGAPLAPIIAEITRKPRVDPAKIILFPHCQPK